ncbi:folliculin-like [Teleopsis dalmanni]|uniref:folliculin-like n=1 Tax=Teleopsis dalmanni TaxID=139649 RepID=UPI0018CE3B77|nr:folliculin-like [Teleopsis dalmanni]XP_037939545.1 folliculin-like [Teleopsis dalmanni]XP_037940219.1 folliculin-like [Teleopsis dalmanni]XP_037940298.1 folliculin-like [Teleopsis dalmanni]
MNAVIALCNFCQAHGPCPIFCTLTLRSKLDDLHLDQQINNKLCAACNSLGQSNALYSKDTESGATFLSTQTAALPEVATLVKYAAIQSLSSEINCNKDGGFVFFGDSTQGHVLSHTFHVSDLQARGFYQLFSIIILMKDKYFLLNTKPFLAEHLRRISSEIQASAHKIKEDEEAKDSPRQRRLSGAQLLVQTPRSLVELTGEDNIYAILHSHFSWVLLAGSRFLTEHVTFGNLPWLPPQSSGQPPKQRLTYNITTLPMIQKFEETLDDPEQEEFYSLRHIKQVVRNDLFTTVCYCALTGVKIIVRGSPERTFNFMLCLRKLLPDKMHNLMRIDAQHQHSISSDYKIISVSNEIPVPIACSSVLRIDYLDKSMDGFEVSVKWPGELPSKWPDLMVKLIKAVNETRFTELVLNKQTKVLIEEWKNKIICLNRAKSTTGQTKLKKVLGIQPQDQPLINYWSAHLA